IAAPGRLLQGIPIRVLQSSFLQHGPYGAGLRGGHSAMLPWSVRGPWPASVSSPMNPAEFANIARSEREFWWYRGMRDILFRLLDPLAPPPGARVLEAGCGTGYLSQLLEQRYGWRMTPLDLGQEALEYARGYGLDRLVQADITALPFGD